MFGCNCRLWKTSFEFLQYTGCFVMFSAITNTKRLRRNLHTVVVDIDNSLAAVPFDFFGVCRKLARSSSSSAINGRSLDFCLHRHPVSVNCLYHTRMVLSVGGSFVYFARNARCTVTTDLLCHIPTHKTTSPPQRPFSHYVHSHRLAAGM